MVLASLVQTSKAAVWRVISVTRRLVELPRYFAKRVLRDAPFGERVVAALMKRRLLSGRSPALSSPADVGRYFDQAIADLKADGRDRLVYFEAGVYAGATLAEWSRRCAEADMPTTLFGADSFAGLPDSAGDDEGSWFAGEFYCPIAVTEWNLERLGVEPGSARLIKGWFDETLTPELAAEVGSVDVVMLDADTYLSTVPVLEFIEPLLPDRAWLVFDDWYSGGNFDPQTGGTHGEGVERAFAEWTDRPDFRWKIEEIGDYDLEFQKGKRRPAGHVVRLVAI